jgi:hypothetical protein
MKAGKQGIDLDPNDWEDNIYWFEDEPEVFEFMEKNEEKIKLYSENNGLSIKASIDILYNLRISK